MSDSDRSWLDQLRLRHSDAFNARDWRAHVAALNDQLGLSGRHRFTESRWAPESFVGALGSFEPGGWLALISLNPKEHPEDDRNWHEEQEWTADALWAYLSRVDLRGFAPGDYYYAKWCYPILLLLSELTGEEQLLEAPAESYFYRVAAFELIPYASHEYLSGTYERMAEDPGCQLSRETALATIMNCPPAAILANGLDTALTVPGWLPLDVPAQEHRYESVWREGKQLRHWQSSVTVGGRVVPFAGFPFLRSQSGHNAFAEIRQLGREILARA